MSEFYTLPITTAKTNDSYIIPTSTQSSLFSSRSHGKQEQEEQRQGRKPASFAKKLKNFFS